MNRYPSWMNLLVLGVVLFGAFFAWPNIYPEDPAVQIARDDAVTVEPGLATRITGILQAADVEHSDVYEADGRLLFTFSDEDSQKAAQDAIRESLASNYLVAVNRSPRVPGWMRSIGLKPMSLGLDLRGGVHFLLEVDMKKFLEQDIERYSNDVRALFRDKENDVRYRSVTPEGQRVIVQLRDAADLDRALELLNEFEDGYEIEAKGADRIEIGMTEDRIRERQNFAIEQNTVTLRNRVNELGVAEPIVQRQGEARIVVQLPGVQDATQAKNILGKTATLEFRLVDMERDPYEAKRTGRPPLGTKIYTMREDLSPILLKRDVIAGGDNLVDAASGFDENSQPAVHVTLDAKGGKKMGDTTKDNVGNRMAVVFIERETEELEPGDPIPPTDNCAEFDVLELDDGNRRFVCVVEEVINAATIQGVFSSRFQITGLDQLEAVDLALLLRAGALAAPVDIVEERTVGPSLGQENIKKGFSAVALGFLAVVLFMAFYYKFFGLVADLALFANLVIIVALLSLLGAALTLPGIAGIVLTVGMAVDANVLIFERIREELRNGNTPQASIHAGYEKAFTSIADANITTLIAAIVLWTFGTGPIKGFAITLSLGIMTSMFTAIIGSRAVVNMWYGGKRIEKLAI